MSSDALPTPLHPVLDLVTRRVIERSRDSRAAYLRTMASLRKPGPYRAGMGCANAAHAFAAMPEQDKLVLRQEREPNLGIVTAYNDMLSAHQPYEHYPEQIRATARQLGATAQVAGGVPAMCDGVTQGYEGMELSLFSRDVIAMAAAVALSHNVFDSVLCLGICDKIVPGLVIGALQFGHLPAVFVPAGPMTSGLSNDDKARVRQQYAQGLVDRQALLAAEEAAYHGAGTCTFYGTANSNQMLMEIMGLQLPGSSFVNPGTPLRQALTDFAVWRALRMRAGGPEPLGMAEVIDEKAIVNGIVGLLATGGSTNHTLHLVAMARAAGIRIDWDDFAELSEAVPLLARVYPNGKADVNHFHAAGGMGFLIAQLLQAGLLHADVNTILGHGLHRFAVEPWLDNGQLAWRAAPQASADESVLRPVAAPFSADGGLKRLRGNLGRAVVKTSAVKPEHRLVHAPAVVVESQQALAELYKQGALERDFVAVVRFQGPQANGMPELHKLTPILGILQDKGFKVALVTDGRMSGASGKVPAAIHVSPEAVSGGAIARVQDGDMIRLDCDAGLLELEVADTELGQRTASAPDLSANGHGYGRELFGLFRRNAGLAENGASALFGND
ncbi:phosphogluconate dehydratase [Malikia granosa]|uniref:Phosphogluconate dehydratase n=1 Tax=Malikia granosa TaxID=263067 RepID=A0A2S9K2X2_9BURK|nr:phosphogluconate dehydratase [Malikia granosa]PRD64820.1 phosphogluconate dehydratase [Malikia granosa]